MTRGRRWRRWLRHCTTSLKVAGSIPDDATGIFQWYDPSGCTVALGLTEPLTEMSTRNVLWLVRRADNLTTFKCRLSWNLGAPGPALACIGIILPLAFSRAWRVLERRSNKLLGYNFFVWYMFAIQSKVSIQSKDSILNPSQLLIAKTNQFCGKGLYYTGLLLFLFVEYEFVELYVFFNPPSCVILV